ncbi:MAG: hypothetical protein ACAI44_33925 [Candidatus Sericytochromatia bacterium]
MPISVGDSSPNPYLQRSQPQNRSQAAAPVQASTPVQTPAPRHTQATYAAAGTRTLGSQSRALNPSQGALQIKQGIDRSDPQVLGVTARNLLQSPTLAQSFGISPESLSQARQQLRPVSQNAVLNLGTPDATVTESGRSLRLKTDGTVFDPSRLPGPQGCLQILGHGSGDGKTVGGKSPDQLAQMLKTAGITRLDNLRLVSCNSQAFVTALGQALDRAGISVNRIEGFEGRIAVSRASGEILSESSQGPLDLVPGHDGTLDPHLQLLGEANTLCYTANLADPHVFGQVIAKLQTVVNEVGVHHNPLHLMRAASLLVQRLDGQSANGLVVLDRAVALAREQIAAGGPPALIARAAAALQQAAELLAEVPARHASAPGLHKESLTTMQRLITSSGDPAAVLKASEDFWMDVAKGYDQGLLSDAEVTDFCRPVLRQVQALALDARVPAEQRLQAVDRLNELAEYFPEQHQATAELALGAALAMAKEADTALRAPLMPPGDHRAQLHDNLQRVAMAVSALPANEATLRQASEAATLTQGAIAVQMDAIPRIADPLARTQALETLLSLMDTQLDLADALMQDRRSQPQAGVCLEDLFNRTLTLLRTPDLDLKTETKGQLLRSLELAAGGKPVEVLAAYEALLTPLPADRDAQIDLADSLLRAAGNLRGQPDQALAFLTRAKDLTRLDDALIERSAELALSLGATGLARAVEDAGELITRGLANNDTMLMETGIELLLATENGDAILAKARAVVATNHPALIATAGELLTATRDAGLLVAASGQLLNSGDTGLMAKGVDLLTATGRADLIGAEAQRLIDTGTPAQCEKGGQLALALGAPGLARVIACAAKLEATGVADLMIRAAELRIASKDPAQIAVGAGALIGYGRDGNSPELVERGAQAALSLGDPGRALVQQGSDLLFATGRGMSLATRDPDLLERGAELALSLTPPDSARVKAAADLLIELGRSLGPLELVSKGYYLMAATKDMALLVSEANALIGARNPDHLAQSAPLLRAITPPDRTARLSAAAAILADAGRLRPDQTLTNQAGVMLIATRDPDLMNRGAGMLVSPGLPATPAGKIAAIRMNLHIDDFLNNPRNKSQITDTHQEVLGNIKVNLGGKIDAMNRDNQATLALLDSPQELLVFLGHTGAITQIEGSILKWSFDPSSRPTGVGSLGTMKISRDEGVKGRPGFSAITLDKHQTRAGEHRRHITAWHSMRTTVNALITRPGGGGVDELVAQMYPKLEASRRSNPVLARACDEVEEYIKKAYPRETPANKKLMTLMFVMNSNPSNLWPGNGRVNSTINTASHTIQTALGPHRGNRLELTRIANAWEHDGNGIAGLRTNIVQNAKYRAAQVIKEALRDPTADCYKEVCQRVLADFEADTGYYDGGASKISAQHPLAQIGRELFMWNTTSGGFTGDVAEQPMVRRLYMDLKRLITTWPSA